MSIRSVRNVAPPNYPVATREYNQQGQDQFLNVLRLFSNNVANAINAPKVFASYYDTTTQPNAGATSVNLMSFDTTVVAYGSKIGSPTSRVYVTETGIYNIQFSAQFDKTSGAGASIYIWLRINGTDVPNSATIVAIQGTNAQIVPAWNFVIRLEANDYVEIAWASSSTTVELSAFAAQTGPPVIPAIPSIILTVAWVSNVSV